MHGPRLAGRLLASLPRRSEPATSAAAFGRTTPFSTSIPAPHPPRYRRFGEPPFGQHPDPPTTVWAKLAGRHRPNTGWRTPPTWVWWVAGASGGYYVLHLERVEETGRWRFMDTSPETEMASGDQAYRQALHEYGSRILPPNHPTSRYVASIASRIIEASALPKHGEPEPEAGGSPQRRMDWRVHVIDDRETKNAFVLPGGKIFVFTGILPVCANADGLAAVLGHEVAHQVARHTAERLSSMKVLFALTAALSLLGLDFGVSRTLVTLCLQLPNSRTNEVEADRIGLNMMARACFDPAEAVRLWQRMDSSDRAVGAELEFLQTHPAHRKRITRIQEQLTEAQKLKEERCGFTSRAFSSMREWRP